MATPLGELLRQLRTDPDVQTRFHQSPAEYLHDHGWGDLDAADVQEAMLLLADAAPATEAAGWISAGGTIDPDSGDAAAALDTAIGALGGAADIDATDRFDDVAELDDIESGDGFDPGELDGITAADTADTAASDAAVDTTSRAVTDSSVETVETAFGSSASTEPGLDIDIDELDELDTETETDTGFDPTAPDTPSHDDTPLTEDPTDTIGTDLDPDPDWDDPS